MKLGPILRWAGTILAGVAFVVVLVTGGHGLAHTAALLGYGGATLIGAGTLIQP